VARAEDAALSSNFALRQFKLVVNSPSPVITTSSLSFGNVGSAFSRTLTATGAVGTLTWGVQPFTYLPPGITLSPAGILGGTPTATGQFFFTVTLSDSAGGSTTRSFTLPIYPAGAFPPVTFLQGPNFGTYSIGHVAVPLAASGGDGSNYTWQFVDGTLPPGISLRIDPEWWFSANATAGLIGVATTPGTYHFTLRVTSAGVSATQSCTLKVSALIGKDYWTLPDASVNAPYPAYTLTPLNNAGPVTWTVQRGLPPGITISSAGVITGTPTTSGVFGIDLTLNDGVDSVHQGLTLNVYDIQITTPGLLPNATQNAAYSATVAASGGTAPYAFTTCTGTGCSGEGSTPSIGLPSGLTLDPSTGLISGIVNTGPGTWAFTLTVTDSNFVSRIKHMSIDIIGVPITLPAVAPYGSWFEDCTVGMSCLRGVNVFNGGTAPFTWTASGLPAGMGIRSGSGLVQWWINPDDAEIWGIATSTGDFNITVTVTDALGVSTRNVFPLRISPMWRSNHFNYVPATVGEFYSQRWRIVGGPSRPLVGGAATSDETTLFTGELIEGQLPFDVTFNPSTLVVSGTPQESGNFSPVIHRFTDLAGSTLDSRDYPFVAGAGGSTIQINTFYDLGILVQGSFFSRQLSACCVPSYAWSVVGGTPPPGLTLSSSGFLSGTLTAAGTYRFAIRVEDATFSANYAVRQFLLVVNAGTAPVITTSTVPFGNVGLPYNQTLLASGGVGAITWSLVTRTRTTFLPEGFTLSPSGVLSGTPTSTGQFFFTVTATDSVGQVASRSYSLAIYALGEVPPLNLAIGTNFGPNLVGPFSLQLTTNGGVAPYHYSLTPGADVVPGMRVQDGQPLPTFNTSTGSYLGVIATPGVYRTSIRVTDAAAHTFDKAITITVSPLANLSQTSLPKATVGIPYSFDLVRYGGSGTYAWSVFGSSVLPPGLSLSASGHLSGSPLAAGSFGFSITLTDLITSNTITIFHSLTVDPFRITTAGVLPVATVGTPYSQSFAASGCASGCTWTMFVTLGGLSMSADGVLSGTPTASTNTFFTVQASGSAGTVQKVVSLQILNNTLQPLAISTSSIGPNVIGGLSQVALFAQGGTPPYSWSIQSGSLPTGISLQRPGENIAASLGPGFTYLAGRAVEAGLYDFTLELKDATDTTVTRSFRWNISRLAFQYFNLPIVGTTLINNPLV
jgi:hypothetical protein